MNPLYRDTIPSPDTIPTIEKRGPGRPRLPTPERRRNILASKAKWRLENYEYYINQKRELACRPEYLARRRYLRAIRLLPDDATSETPREDAF